MVTPCMLWLFCTCQLRFVADFFVKVFRRYLASLKYCLVVLQGLSQEARQAFPKAGTCFPVLMVCYSWCKPGTLDAAWRYSPERGFKIPLKSRFSWPRDYSPPKLRPMPPNPSRLLCLDNDLASSYRSQRQWHSLSGHSLRERGWMVGSAFTSGPIG